MFNVSREFAPPFSLISPFFIIGTLFYLIASLFLPIFGADVSYLDINVVGWVHLFLLGFVMMIIFGAMAQLIPVVLEVGHFSIDFYYLIWPMLGVGTILMVLGFLIAPGVLPYGGVIVLIAMLIFLADTIMTLRKVKYISLTVKTIGTTNSFLLLGILIGFAMALGIGTGVGIDITKWLNAHIVLVLGGYVTLTIMGMSLILLPMFGLSHGFNEKPINLSFKIMVSGILFYLLATLFDSKNFKFLSMLIIIGSLLLYLYQIWLIYKTRVRKEYDIWFKSMVFGYFSLALSLLLGLIALINSSELIEMSSAWFLIMGFVTFLINGHLYKIIPFLVWFERYSPLVGKESVPMLADMVPKKEAEYQFWFTTVGVTVAGLGLLFGNSAIFKAGSTFIIVGAIFLTYSVFWMINFGKK